MFKKVVLTTYKLESAEHVLMAKSKSMTQSLMIVWLVSV